MRLVRGCVSGQLASVILPGTFLFFKRKNGLLCFSTCIYLTGLHPRGDQAQLHPQCGVKIAIQSDAPKLRSTTAAQCCFKKKNLFNTL